MIERDQADEAYFEQRTDSGRCQSGETEYCSYAENHPVDTALSFVGGMVGIAGLDTFIFGCGAAALSDTSLWFLQRQVWKTGWFIKDLLTTVINKRMQALTNSANAELGANPALAQNLLSDAEYAAGQTNVGIARMEYGNALERLVRRGIQASIIDRLFFRPVGGPSNPDFVGKGIISGMNFDITTPGQIASHLARPYGPGLNILTYLRPGSFFLFPQP